MPKWARMAMIEVLKSLLVDLQILASMWMWEVFFQPQMKWPDKPLIMMCMWWVPVVWQQDTTL